MPDPRLATFKILQHLDQTGRSLKESRDHYFQQNKLSPQNRARILVMTNEVVRWQGRLDYWLKPLLNKPLNQLPPKVKTLLRMGAFELKMDEGVPPYAAIAAAVDLTRKISGNRFTGLVNAVLRQLSKSAELSAPSPEDISKFSKWASIPTWILNRWAHQFGSENMVNLVNYFNDYSPLDIRLNLNKLDPESFLTTMAQDNIVLAPHSTSHRFFRVKKGGNLLRKHPLFFDGTFSFQDRGAGAIVELLSPQSGESILDVCAAPGTKSAYIAELMGGEGQVLASDVHENRVKIARKDSARHYPMIRWSVKDATKSSFPEAHRILIDAPCSGTGVMGRKPDIRWRRSEESIRANGDLQLSLLNHMSRFLKPGGVLVYGTCSLEREENWNVVEAFLKLNDTFFIETGKNIISADFTGAKGNLETFPPRNRVDGMFAVRMRKP